ncbi:D-glycero-beta-D-manno-heptose 1,7-bisphosphate 7-phosphatase [Alteromonas sp. 5E99-2]|uniref:D-glycero-beta-D-manno-heptose 1,7-bisphosphate 7-phosphatase n=1 Tax=Alteromonas sp. 5E99-2 TaxID=2817683 RepID=UPI001A98241B|nr:D-glycero-beta-D-manno-heptose 1,7-bisphosphate 7-phosphatase [Alteromonas sp. 5E99-2]MBO1255533.1 D-glycero-beta-D-manno-heptose 1,7-bisphosphate 7-phosphatase [Alteromonas sp. 5E99-2]
MNKNKALFLDRDGVINQDIAYLYKPEDFVWIPGIIALMQRFQMAGYKLIIVTNQSGIGRGYYSESDFHILSHWMKTSLAKSNVNIDAIYYCPHHPTEAKGPYLKECECRKPSPGMLTTAINEHSIDPEQSVLIGDSWRDIEAAVAAQVKTSYYFTADVKEQKRQHILQSNGAIVATSQLSSIKPLI